MSPKRCRRSRFRLPDGRRNRRPCLGRPLRRFGPVLRLVIGPVFWGSDWGSDWGSRGSDRGSAPIGGPTAAVQQEHQASMDSFRAAYSAFSAGDEVTTREMLRLVSGLIAAGTRDGDTRQRSRQVCQPSASHRCLAHASRRPGTRSEGDRGGGHRHREAVRRGRRSYGTMTSG